MNRTIFFFRCQLALVILISCLSFFHAAVADESKAKSPSEFTIVLVPDTQYYSLKHPETYRVQMAWIKNQTQKENIQFVVHLGDIVHNNTLPEWQVADKAHRLLEGVVPFSMVPGNHDMAVVEEQLTRDTSRYNEFFPPARFEKFPWYGGHLGKTNDNNFCFFETSGMKFMVVSLEFAPTDKALQWASEVIAKNRDRKVIVATHCYMRPQGRDTTTPMDYRLKGNSGEGIWQKLIRKHENIFLVVSGHVLGVGMQTSINDAGGKVFEMLTDYQGLPEGGNGWLRTLKFVPQENKIHVRAYSPLLDRDNKDPQHSFTLDYQMSAAKPQDR